MALVPNQSLSPPEMQNRPLLTLALAALLSTAASVPAHGQEPPIGGLDLSIGALTVDGGFWRDRDGQTYLIEFHFNALVERPRPSTVLMGVHAGYHDFEGRNGCPGEVTNECLVPPFPDLLFVGMSGSWQQAITRSTVGQITGAFSMYQPSSGGPAVGVRGSVMFAQYIIPRVALQGSYRLSLLPEFRGSRVNLKGWSAGIRLH